MIHDLARFERAADQCTVVETQISTALFEQPATLRAHVAEVDGEVAAMALWFLNFSTWDGIEGIHLEDLYVRSRFRRLGLARGLLAALAQDRKSTRLNSSHRTISYAVFCLKKKKHTYGKLLVEAKQRGLQLQLPTREVYRKGPGMIFRFFF